MASLKQVLQTEPSNELVFQGPFDKVVTVYLKLTNPSDENVCFKIMATRPSEYCVKPNRGILTPNQTTELTVMLKPFKYDENQAYSHKLMVRSIFAPREALEDRIDLMWKEVAPSAVMATKLDCRFIPRDTIQTFKSVPERFRAELSSTEDHVQHKQQIHYHDTILVVSIDIGNTYTRYAFSFRYQYEEDPTYIRTVSDLSSSEQSEANPTVILMDDNRKFDSFGYDAVDNYLKHRQGHIFSEIKKTLYEQLIDTDIHHVKVKNRLGSKITAVEAFRAILNRIQKHFDAVQDRNQTGVRPEDIYWVITVPSVFTDQATTLLKTAALMSGIAKNKLHIAFESVAALEYCKNMYQHTYKKRECTVHRPRGEGHSDAELFQNGRQYIVVDIGGETVDFTVLGKDNIGKVIEHHKVCFVGCGGNTIHKALDNVLTEIVGDDAYFRFRTEEYEEYRGHGYMMLHKCFDEKMKVEGIDSDQNITIALPDLIMIELQSTVSFKTALGASPYAGEICVIGDKLRLSAALWKRLVAEYCLKIVEHLKCAFAKSSYDRNSCLLFVGGYSEFKAVREALIKEFYTFDIFIPKNPEYATVGGGVMLGHIPPLTVYRAPVSTDTIVMIEDDRPKINYFELDDQAVASDFVQSVADMSLSSDFIEDESIVRSTKIQTGLKSLSERMKGTTQEITVKRNDIIVDVITAYRDIDVSRPVTVYFSGEEDRDMTKEMFGLFWEKVCNVWFRGENAVIPLVPVTKRVEARQLFPVLGKILEHTLCILGHFPPQLCRSLILAIAHPDQDVNADLVLDDYLLFVPERESTLLSNSLKQPDWSEQRKKRLARFFSVNKISIHPTQKSFREDLLNIAYTEIIDSSHMYVVLMRRGISDFALTQFFDLLDSDGIRSEYEAIEPTTEKLAHMIEDIFDKGDFNREEKIIINYLSNIVCDMSKKQLRQFLVWLTGSPCMPQKINIAFRTTVDTTKLPRADTGKQSLELSREYTSYQDFERALMDAVLHEFFTSKHAEN